MPARLELEFKRFNGAPTPDPEAGATAANRVL
jgi:hypothetical protein